MKNIASTLLLGMITITAFAQSLPNKQEVSLRAPANIKIDGMATEWNNQFQAYNHATDVYYTVSNDDDNLYFVVQATKPCIIEKILNVGITVTINNKGEKNDKSGDNVSVNFPLMDYKVVPRIIVQAGAKTTDIFFNTGPGVGGAYKPDFDIKPSDSLKNSATKLLIETAKTINVKGIKEIPGDELSVYNEQNIRVAAAFDHAGAYTYELEIPIKYLHLNNNQKFSYNVKIQSRQDVLRPGMVTRYNVTMTGREDMDQDLDATTDFWGEYTLAKK